MNERQILVGRKEIVNYTGRSWPTLEQWIERRRFPAKKLDGTWISQGELIDSWLSEQIELTGLATK